MTESPKQQGVPQVLTRPKIGAIIGNLDASDVLECYLLTREVVLHGLANSTLSISKQALGIRYRPSPSSAKKPLELTLEYGPMRSSASEHPSDRSMSSATATSTHLLHDVVPRLHDADQTVSWENDAQVYFTHSITAETYSDANFIASLTGAVLPHLLEQACQYVAAPRTRRYQPFLVNEVVAVPPADGGANSNSNNNNNNNAKTLLTSSSDVDFCQFALNTLAAVGVVLSPVIPPAPSRAVLQARNVKRVPTLEHGTEIHDFYTHIYSCVEQLASAAVVEISTTSSSTSTSTTTTMALPDGDAPTGDGNNPEGDDDGGRRRLEQKGEEPTTTLDAITPSDGSDMTRNDNNDDGDDDDDDDDDDGTDDTTPADVNGPTETSSTMTTPLDLDNNADEQPQQQQQNEEGNGAVTATETPTSMTNQKPPSASPTLTPVAATDAPVTAAPTKTVAPTSKADPTASPVSNSEQAQQAAQQAQQAADAASQAGNQEAADAASQAADAAHKAAEITAAQAAQVLQQGLLTGDGPTVARILSKCLADPVYGLDSIRNNRTLQNSNNNDNVTVYLYWDGHFYYTADLVPPYVQVVRQGLTLPAPASLANTNHAGDAYVDWAVAVVILGMAFLGSLLLVQAVMGRNLRIIPSLYKFQRWYFDPLEHDYNDLDDRSQADIMRQMPHELSTDDDVIPLSMGGAASPTSNNRTRAQPSGDGPPRPMLSPKDSFAEGGDHHRNNSNHINNSMNGANESSCSSAYDLELTEMNSNNSSADDIPPHVLRDPNLVPDLTSRSKVAVPVSLTPNGNMRKTPRTSSSSSLSVSSPTGGELA